MAFYYRSLSQLRQKTFKIKTPDEIPKEKWQSSLQSASPSDSFNNRACQNKDSDVSVIEGSWTNKSFRKDTVPLA